jgi:hypothetical protein
LDDVTQRRKVGRSEKQYAVCSRPPNRCGTGGLAYGMILPAEALNASALGWSVEAPSDPPGPANDGNHGLGPYYCERSGLRQQAMDSETNVEIGSVEPCLSLICLGHHTPLRVIRLVS